MNIWRIPSIVWATTLVLSVSPAEPARAQPIGYTVTQFNDPTTGNVENRFFFNGFHFSTLLRDPSGKLYFRPHPDQSDPNGWGTSWLMNPFLSGADPGLG